MLASGEWPDKCQLIEDDCHLECDDSHADHGSSSLTICPPRSLINLSLSVKILKYIFVFILNSSCVYIVHLKSNPLLLELLFVLRITIISGKYIGKMPTRKILHNL